MKDLCPDVDQRVLFCQTIFSILDHVMHWMRTKDMAIAEKRKGSEHKRTCIRVILLRVVRMHSLHILCNVCTLK